LSATLIWDSGSASITSLGTSSLGGQEESLRRHGGNNLRINLWKDIVTAVIGLCVSIDVETGVMFFFSKMSHSRLETSVRNYKASVYLYVVNLRNII
jgi:hypothetical protein